MSGMQPKQLRDEFTESTGLEAGGRAEGTRTGLGEGTLAEEWN